MQRLTLDQMLETGSVSICQPSLNAGFEGYQPQVHNDAVFVIEACSRGVIRSKLYSDVKIGAATLTHYFMVSNSEVADGVVTRADVRLTDTYVGRSAVIGSSITLEDAFIGEGAKVCVREPSAKANASDRKREIHPGLLLGAGVTLHPEVQLGGNAIVPTQESIEMLGRYGEKQRMVTVYGGAAGPYYSVGCQFGISYDTLEDRITHATETTPSSAREYRGALRGFRRAGARVQAAYNDALPDVNALIERRATWVNAHMANTASR